MIEKYRKGRHVYTRWDKQNKQVTVVSKAKEKAPAPEVPVEVPPETANGIRCNLFAVFHSPDEFILDAGIVPSQGTRAKVAKRMVMSPRTAKQLMLKLKETIGG